MKTADSGKELAVEQLDAGGVRATLRRLKTIMAENRDRLIALDSALGDGDLGLTMVTGFARAADLAEELAQTLPGPSLTRAGVNIANSAPSTMGTLVGTGFMSGGKALGESSAMSTREAAVFFRAMSEGIMQRGKTKPGNKTIVDAILPAALALEKAALDKMTLGDAMELAWRAACDGNSAAKALMARHGRAAYYQGQSIGLEDPGCAVGVLILQGFRDATKTKTRAFL